MFSMCHRCFHQKDKKDLKPLKDKKAKTVIHGFKKIVNRDERKLNKLWVYQGREFCNSSMQKWLYDNDTSTYDDNDNVLHI